MLFGNHRKEKKEHKENERKSTFVHKIAEDGSKVWTDYNLALEYARELGESEELISILDRKLDELEPDWNAYSRGMHAYEAKNYQRALYLFLKGAKHGDKYAQVQCGTMFDEGKGTLQDKAEAFTWFEKAAEQGHEDAQYRCGMMYLNGEGIERNTEKALLWLEKAAEQDVPDAQYQCALLYMQGEGIPRNLDKALDLMHKAADHGGKDAGYKWYCCGMLYDNEACSKHNKSMAFACFTAAADFCAFVEAQYQCGLRFYRGEGTGQSIFAAKDYFLEAAKKGHQWAQYYYALLCLENEGLIQDQSWAKKYLQEAAACDDDQAAKEAAQKLLEERF